MERKTLEERRDDLLDRILRELEETLAKSKADLSNGQLSVSDYLKRLDKISRIALGVKSGQAGNLA